MKYGDAVVLVQKSPGDGSVSRTNAIVLASTVQSEERTHAMKDHRGATVADGEYLALAYPNLGLVPEGQVLNTRTPEVIFKLTYDTPRWKDGAWIGWEPAPSEEDVRVLTEALDVARQAIGRLGEEVATLMANQNPDDPARPSAADLDAIAAEQKAREATEKPKGAGWGKSAKNGK